MMKTLDGGSSIDDGSSKRRGHEVLKRVGTIVGKDEGDGFSDGEEDIRTITHGNSFKKAPEHKLRVTAVIGLNLPHCQYCKPLVKNFDCFLSPNS